MTALSQGQIPTDGAAQNVEPTLPHPTLPHTAAGTSPVTAAGRPAGAAQPDPSPRFEQGSAQGAEQHLGQSDSPQPRPSDDELAQALVEGALGKAFKMEPEHLRFGLHVARQHMQRGALGEALQLYSALVICMPTEVDFQVGLSNCALEVGENALALQAASVVIALAPRDCRGYLLSARACLGLGHASEAQEDLRDAISFGMSERNADVVADARRLLQSLERLDG